MKSERKPTGARGRANLNRPHARDLLFRAKDLFVAANCWKQERPRVSGVELVGELR